MTAKWQSRSRVPAVAIGRELTSLQGQVPVAATEGVEEMVGAPAPSIDLLAILVAALRHWKLIAAFTLGAFTAVYGGLKFVPQLYKSTVEILVFDPQRQMDASVQKPISPFVDAVGYDAMNTEINILKSKSVALRVARELGLDNDPEFQSHNRLGELWGWLESFWDRGTGYAGAQSKGGTEDEKAERLDKAADALRERLQVWPESYIIFVSTSSQTPIQAQRLASTVANDYLATQREARQEALQRVASWLKGRVDELQSRVLDTDSSIEKLKAEMGMTGANNLGERQIGELIAQLVTARSQVEEKRARLEQARRVKDTRGDLQSIPELSSSAVLTGLRQKQMELNLRASDLENKVGPIANGVRGELAGINNQITAEAEHLLGNMKNAYDIAVRQEKALESNLQKITGSGGNLEMPVRLQQLQRVAETDRNLYQNYSSQYNDLAQRRTLQEASARIISPATLPTSPNSSRRKLSYAIGGVLGLGGGFMLAFLLEYFRPGIKSGAQMEQSFGLPVVGIIPLLPRPKSTGTFEARLLRATLDEPLSGFTEAVRAMRISFELSNAGSKVLLVTSALPAEGKSTVAILLAVSSANSGKRAVLVDCDFRQRSSSAAFGKKDAAGLSELLRGAAELKDVITRDAATQTYVIPAGSMVPNAADWLMSGKMSELVAELRKEFDCVIMDASPLLPVVDALPLATMADKVLLVVEWARTPLACISEAFKVLRPAAHRLAGVVLNKADQTQMPGYAAYYRSAGKYLAKA
jgi:succinoglycan biosynthesis transport protein ExoP